MAATTKTKKTKKAATESTTTAAPKKAMKTKPPAARMTLAEAMAALEKVGDAQTRKTWTRHGAPEPMFGVKFGDLAKIVKRIGVDHDLALELWETGNTDARTLALKVADPARTTAALLDRWIAESSWRFHGTYIAMLASETAKPRQIADRWLAKKPGNARNAGWEIVGQIALRDVETPDSWFSARVSEIERGIDTAPNWERYTMNQTLIALGGRDASFRRAALAAAKKIGTVDVDHGDTSCKTPEAVPYVEKMWAHAKAKGFETPAAQERARERPRLRC